MSKITQLNRFYRNTNMKTYISIGDFVDILYKIQVKGWDFFQKKLQFSAAARATSTWDIEKLPPTNWWIIPAIRRKWNENITGDENISYDVYITSHYLKNKTQLKMLVPACGTGSHERKFIANGKITSVEGFDISPICIKEAQKKAENYSNISFDYQIADAHSLTFEENKYDIILFHSSLHHIDKMDSFIQKIEKSLKPDGILVLHDFVGARRLHWTSEQLTFANQLLQLIPPHFRTKWKTNTLKKRIYRPGWWRMYISDPSEAVESDSIIPTLHKYFRTIEEKKIGGDLLHLVLKDISHHFVSDLVETNQILADLFEKEAKYLENKSQSDFMFGVYQKK